MTIKINLRPRPNPRKDLGWEDESGCNRCGKVSSAYVEIGVPISIEAAAEEFKTELCFTLCGSCLEEMKKIIDEIYLEPARSLGDKAPNF